jgi:hypothetical protein
MHLINIVFATIITFLSQALANSVRFYNLDSVDRFICWFPDPGISGISVTYVPAHSQDVMAGAASSTVPMETVILLPSLPKSHGRSAYFPVLFVYETLLRIPRSHLSFIFPFAVSGEWAANLLERGDSA